MYEKLISWVEHIKEKNHSSGAALLIIKDNQTVLEHYSGTQSNFPGAKQVTSKTRFNIASARKSYLGLAVAYAVHEGKIGSLDDFAVDYFPEWDPDLLGSTTIRHLLTHSHGLNTAQEGVPFREFSPGQNWAYRGINIRMMTELVNRLYQKSFPQLLKERVFDPMGFSETGWEIEPHENLAEVIVEPEERADSSLGSTRDGMDKNLFVSARELAQWGNLHLNMGKAAGKQIVPEEVVRLATTIQSPVYENKDLPQNGFFWFVQGEPALQSELGEKVPRGSYQILGVTGPTVLVIPKHNMLIVKMYNKRYNYGGENYLHYLREFSNLAAEL
ncbi:serine hydrolase domain-containing protein [Rossellomorea vietnamensis]|uniref:serine hydrolase domain-containing protein n=1 Tax=Rossellomorea vietnamensis TaxID=218284 RepID=UPI003CEB70DD